MVEPRLMQARPGAASFGTQDSSRSSRKSCCRCVLVRTPRCARGNQPIKKPEAFSRLCAWPAPILFE
jgi:hypothetical protein